MVLTDLWATGGNRLIVHPRHGGDNQLWRWEGDLLLSKTGYVAEVAGGRREHGTNAICGKSHGQSNQKWRKDGNRIVSCMHGLVLAIKGGSKSKNSEVILANGPQLDNIGMTLVMTWIFRSV